MRDQSQVVGLQQPAVDGFPLANGPWVPKNMAGPSLRTQRWSNPTFRGFALGEMQVPPCRDDVISARWLGLASLYHKEPRRLDTSLLGAEGLAMYLCTQNNAPRDLNVPRGL
ncbi:unnamed protein product [Clonostachys byssicola]|uniref:Uncharacterized protein n=1 Tax=Clonostachys byssicola TaxID=160290 RepID=A0A9N9YAE5_9HYPO|nr:unnamed protein product [Clonostachys byssicola]